MHFEPTPSQTAFMQQAVASGRYASVEEAVRNAMEDWENKERARMEIILALEEAEADIRHGRYTCYERPELPKLLEDIKREARQQRQESGG